MGTTMQWLICIVLISSTFAKPLTSPVPTTSTLSSTTQEASKAPSSLSTEKSVVTEISHHEIKTQTNEQKELSSPTETKNESEAQPDVPEDGANSPETETEISSDGEILTYPQGTIPPIGMDGAVPDDMDESFDRMIPISIGNSEPQDEIVPLEIRPRFDEPVPMEEEIMPEEIPDDEELKSESVPFPSQEESIMNSPQEGSETMEIPEEVNQSEEGIGKPEAEMEMKEPEEEPRMLPPEPPIYNDDRLPSYPQSSEVIMPPDSESEDVKDPMPPVINKQLSDYLTNIRGAMKEYDEDDLRTWGEKSNMVENDFAPRILDEFPYKI